MLPFIHQSVRDAKTQNYTCHQNMRTYLTGMASTVPNTNTTTSATTEPPATARTNSTASTATNPAATATNAPRVRQRPFSAIRRRLQQSRSHLTATNIATPARTHSHQPNQNAHPPIRQRFQQAARNQVATISSDIRQFFPGAQQSQLSLSKLQHHKHNKHQNACIK
jgi:pyruvate/2-oxoglutarate dehydrogenase complex dihydrolipoamide acyltransferase (E2) component